MAHDGPRNAPVMTSNLAAHERTDVRAGDPVAVLPVETDGGAGEGGQMTAIMPIHEPRLRGTCIGERADRRRVSEAEHYFRCKICGGFIDAPRSRADRGPRRPVAAPGARSSAVAPWSNSDRTSPPRFESRNDCVRRQRH